MWRERVEFRYHLGPLYISNFYTGNITILKRSSLPFIIHQQISIKSDHLSFRCYPLAADVVVVVIIIINVEK